MANIKYPCPNVACNTNNFSFDTVKLVGQCFSCGYRGGGRKLAEQLKVTQDKYTPRMKTVNLSTNLTKPAKDGLEYLHSRGIRGTMIDSIGIKWDGEQLYLPIWCPITEQRSWVRKKLGTKGYYSDALPGMPYVMGRQDRKDFTRCVLVEGPFSLLTPGLWESGYALLGSNLDIVLEKWLRTQQFSKITIWFDPDTTGFEKANIVEYRLKQWHPNVHRVHGWCFDFRDPGEYTHQEAAHLLYVAEQTKLWCPPKTDVVRRLL